MLLDLGSVGYLTSLLRGLQQARQEEESSKRAQSGDGGDDSDDEDEVIDETQQNAGALMAAKLAAKQSAASRRSAGQSTTVRGPTIHITKVSVSGGGVSDAIATAAPVSTTEKQSTVGLGFKVFCCLTVAV